MPTAHTQFAVASSSTTIFAIGGLGKKFRVLNTLEAFDTMTETWNANLRAMPTARSALVVGVIGDFLYVAGGKNERTLDVTEKYQISTNEWSTVVPMHFNRELTCAAVLDSKFYVIGGSDCPTHHSSAEVYTPSTNTWTRITDMSTRRWGCGAVAVGGLIYVFDGSENHESLALDSVEVYNATTVSLHTLPVKVNVARYGFEIAKIFDV